MRRRYHAARLNFESAGTDTRDMSRWAIPLLLAAFLAYHCWSGRAIARPAGVLVPGDPVQENLRDGPRFQLDGYDVRALARFSLDARVLSAERYRFGREAELAPVDLALGWGPMSANEVIERLSIWQGARFYHWSYSGQPPLPLDQIVQHSANMHMIPGDAAVRAELLDARAGNVVHLTGWLVEADAPDGWRWRSSLSRSDSGNGACELVWVETLTLE